ncbi:hypothetical protein GCM10009839_67430 [Catenulispora yoronensis]|uniref:HTH cro/C1-type domain-containing protein n=1 Tax=Catenulispora yoronensis TaxID=450799 RepID=A0ABP5GMA0_9ACTN
MEHTFAALLREERLAAGLTQEELAKRSGIAVRTISDLERGKFPSPRAQTVRMLADGLGLDGPRRDQRERLERAARGVPVGTAPAVMFSRVRIPPTPLIGREDDTIRVADLLSARLSTRLSRIVTLTGPGGVGKTRLAAAAAARASAGFADGVRDVDLVPLQDGDEMLREIAHRLTATTSNGTGNGTANAAISNATSDVADVTDLAARIGPSHLLLVLDNMEHLIEHADLIATLVAACPNLSVLVTSRIPLRVRGEQEYHVAPLPVPESGEESESASVELFTLHAARRRYGWRPTEPDLRHVRAICRALDGLPLAIELAAERIGSLDPGSIVDALATASGALHLLADGPRDLPHRQRSMAASVQWSYEQLPAPGQALLRALSVFPARWRLEAMVAVGGTHAALSVAELVDSHLVQIQEGPKGLTYGLSQPVREFAAEELEQHSEAGPAARRMTDYAVKLADQAEPHLTGPDQATWMDRLEDEHDTLRAALNRLIADEDGEQAIRLSGALWRFWYARGHIRSGRAWLRRALAVLDARDAGQLADPKEQPEAASLARALNGLASLESCLEETAAVPDLYRRAITLWERIGDTAGSSASRTNLGMYEQFYGSPAAARELYHRAAEDARTGGHDRGLGAALVNLGQLLTRAGEDAAAESALDEALEAFRRFGDVRAQADTLGCLAELALERSRPRQARKHAASARRLFGSLQDELGVNQTWEVTARCEAAEGDYAGAGERLSKVVARYEELAYPWGAAEAVTARAKFAAAGGDPDLAYVLATDAVRRWDAIEDSGDAGQEARKLLRALEDDEA